MSSQHKTGPLLNSIFDPQHKLYNQVSISLPFDDLRRINILYGQTAFIAKRSAGTPGFYYGENYALSQLLPYSARTNRFVPCSTLPCLNLSSMMPPKKAICTKRCINTCCTSAVSRRRLMSCMSIGIPLSTVWSASGRLRILTQRILSHGSICCSPT